MEQNQTPRFAVIHYHVLKDLDINIEEYVILNMIFYLSAKTGYCYKPAKSMGEDIGLEKREVQYILQKLVKQGLLERLTNYAIKATDKFIDVAILSHQDYTNDSYSKRKVYKKSPKVYKPVVGGVQKNAQITDARVIENNIEEAPVADKNGTGYKKYLDQRKQLGL